MAVDLEHLTTVHREAMRFAMDGMALRDRGRSAEALPLLRQAYTLERQVALGLIEAFEVEPSRSVMFRSAASLANLCGDRDDALRLIHLGLGGNPPADIRHQLEELEREVEVGSPVAALSTELERLSGAPAAPVVPLFEDAA